jgi:hypothetical protein
MAPDDPIDLNGLLNGQGSSSATAGVSPGPPPPPVKVSMSLTMTGPIAEPERVVRSQLYPAARRCYQRALHDDPTQKGELVVVMRVDPSGEVSSSTIANIKGLSATVKNCVRGAANRLFFSQSVGGEVDVTFTFEMDKK